MIVDVEFTPEENLEVLPGLFVEWYFGRQIVAYRLTTVSQRLLNAMADYVITTLQHWPKNRLYLALHDLTAPGVAVPYGSLTGYDMNNIGITPEGRARADALLNQHPLFLARVALSFNLNVSGHIGKTLINTLLDKHPSITYKSYYKRETAMRWLSSHVAADQSSASTG